MTAMVSSAHPVLRGLPQAEAAAVSSGKPELRPFLPPTRGNFRIISELRVPTGAAWQEGVTMLELPIGAGTVLAAQSSLCADFVREPKSRLVLANALVYLLGREPGLRRAFLYGERLDDLPACLARLAPAVARVPADFAGAEILLVAGDWRAQRLAAAARLPAPADVARYLREGGTILLLNPQPMSIEYLGSLVGAPVYFDAMDSTEVRGVAAGQALLEGIAPEDLAILGSATRAPFRVRLLPGRADVEPLLFAPGIAQYRIGRGVLLALSLPDAGACAAPRVSSLLARLLTNLGVPLGRAPGIDPDAVSLLDE